VNPLPDVGRDPVHCQHCGEGFVHARDLALHRGRRHADTLTDGERAVFEQAVTEEAAWLDAFQRHLVAGLVASPVVLSYLGVAILGLVYDVNTAMLVMPAPGIIGFAVLAYLMAYRIQTRE
jgi:hypothetical protein